MTSIKIGRYEIEREIMRGGMAVVYLAYDPFVNRKVAIKVLSSKLTFDSEYLARFRREAEVVAALEHANIVSAYDFGKHDDHPYIVMRYMPGGSLKERLANGPISLRQLAPVVERVAAALDAAHAQNIVHRDLKPGNILFDAAGAAFLADFGIAKSAQAEGDDLTGDAIIGTPKYLSPEQVRGSELDGRSDVYSLGVVVFQALSGQVPFTGPTPMGIAVARLMEPIPSIREINQDLPEACEDVVKKALAKNPEGRYPTAGDLARDVQDLASGRWYMLKI